MTGGWSRWILRRCRNGIARSSWRERSRPTVVEDATADKPASTSVHRIDEFDAVGQQLKRLREIVGRHLDHGRVQRISDDWHAERCHVPPQLMRASGVWSEPV